MVPASHTNCRVDDYVDPSRSAKTIPVGRTAQFHGVTGICSRPYSCGGQAADGSTGSRPLQGVVHLPNTYQKIPRILSGIVTGRVRTVMYLYHICRVTKKSLHLFIKCDKMGAIWENAAIGLPYIGLRPQRERDGGIRLRAMPGFLPGASA